MRLILRALGALLILLGGYLAFWPVSIDPVAWAPSEDPGFTGVYAANERLSQPELLPLLGYVGPEDLAVEPDGTVYLSVHRATGEGGAILALAPGAGVLGPARPRLIAEIPGRPLGVDVAPNGDLYVADAMNGLVRVGRDRSVSLVLDRFDGAPLGYPNDVAVGPDGTVYLTDSTARWRPSEMGGTLRAGIFDLAEHRATGRLLAYDPETRTARLAADGFSFANGVALSPDGRSAAVVETADYRVWRVALDGAEAGTKTPLIEGLPSFPDNIEPDGEGGFWIGAPSPRRGIVDALAGWPGLRRALFRLPEALRPGPAAHGMALRIDADGRVLETWQDPRGRYPAPTGARVVGEHLYVTSLTAPAIGRFSYKTRAFAAAGGAVR